MKPDRFAIALLFLAGSASFGQPPGQAAYLDPSLSPQRRAAALVSRMTLEEKVLQKGTLGDDVGPAALAEGAGHGPRLCAITNRGAFFPLSRIRRQHDPGRVELTAVLERPSWRAIDSTSSSARRGSPLDGRPTPTAPA